jgi:hypothetical protein
MRILKGLSPNIAIVIIRTEVRVRFFLDSKEHGSCVGSAAQFLVSVKEEQVSAASGVMSPDEDFF